MAVTKRMVAHVGYERYLFRDTADMVNFFAICERMTKLKNGAGYTDPYLIDENQKPVCSCIEMEQVDDGAPPDPSGIHLQAARGLP